MKTVFGIIGTILVGGILLTSCSVAVSQTMRPPTSTTTVEASALVREVRLQGGHSADGTENPALCRLAQQHAKWMADNTTMSHAGSDQRFDEIQRLGGTAQSEIVAYNSYSDLDQAAAVCASSWRASPGHWATMRERWDSYCYAMALGIDGYYCIGLVSNGI